MPPMEYPRDGCGFTTGNRSIPTIDVWLQRLSNPVESLPPSAWNMPVDARLNVVRAVFANPCPIIVSTFYALNYQPFPIVIKKLLQTQRLAERGISIEEEVVPIEHIEHGIPFIRLENIEVRI